MKWNERGENVKKWDEIQKWRKHNVQYHEIHYSEHWKSKSPVKEGTKYTKRRNRKRWKNNNRALKEVNVLRFSPVQNVVEDRPPKSYRILSIYYVYILCFTRIHTLCQKYIHTHTTRLTEHLYRIAHAL